MTQRDLWLFGEPDEPRVFSVPEDLDLGQGLIEFVEEQACRPLTGIEDSEPFLRERIGVYLLFYHGDHPLYRPISEANADGCRMPIYVGKAVPAGTRSGRLRDEEAATRGRSSTGRSSILKRLLEHRRSIGQADNLDVEDFRVKTAPMEVDLAAWGESLLMRHYQPAWNGAVTGFGNHTPGKGRNEQQRSKWDKAHVGRGVVANLRDLRDAEGLDESKLGEEIASHHERMTERLGL